MQHLARAALLLVLLVGGIVYAQTMSKVVTVDSLGIVHYDNARAWASRTINNQGPEVCADCHTETAD